VNGLDHVGLPDGRRADVRVSGPAGGLALVFIHGSPGSRDPIRVWERAAHARGLRLVSLSRPGYGESDRHPGRAVVDVVSDTAAVLQVLGVPRCVVVGWSGGGPHALACAARLDAAAAVLSLAGFAPYDADGLDWFEGLPDDSVAEFAAAVRGEDDVRPVVARWRDEVLDVTGADFASGLEPLLAEGERTVLTAEFFDDVALTVREGFRAGVDGCVDDDLAFVRPWGFDLAEISIPTVIAHGSADLLVPSAHGRWLTSRIPGALSRFDTGDGHFSLAIRRVDAMLDELLEAAGER
jgi:pimeloyl-ACP methyl ester carboxylesterase